MNAALALTGNGGKIMPKSYRRVNVRGWGASTIPRDQLASFCIDVAKARLQDIALLDVSTQELMVVQDTSNFVDVTLTRSWDFSANGGVIALASNLAIAAMVGAVGGAVGGGYQAVLDAMVDNPDYLYTPRPPNGRGLEDPIPNIPIEFVGPVAGPIQANEGRRPRDYVQATPRAMPGHPVGLTVNPAFLDAGTRGTYLADLVTQVLEAPDTLPAAPP